jgi:pyruvate dehydrogenase E2 component (dihydrolipoamide acetyltransferase)
MAVSVVMPALEMAQETGKVVAWRKREGDQVTKGELLLDIETDKAVVEIEATSDGTLSAISAREGDVVPVGQTIAWLLAPGETAPVGAASPQSGRRIEAAPVTAASPPGTRPGAAASIAAGAARISPKARRLAAERGVDLASVRGSGPEGEILAADVLAAAAPGATGGGQAASPGQGSGSIEALTTIGTLMAERTTQAWTTVPHFFVTREVDATALIAAREAMAPVRIDNGDLVKPTYTDLLVGIAARVLRRHPRVNASWAGHGIRVNPGINVGVAMAVRDGVVAPVIRQADARSVAQIAAARHDLAERARSGRLRPADLGEATFTISNLGMYDVDAFTAIIVPPQAAILAVGAIADRAVVVAGQVSVRPTLRLTMSSDHRVVDGAGAAAFLKDLVAALHEAAHGVE